MSYDRDLMLDCVNAFKSGNKQVAEQLADQVQQLGEVKEKSLLLQVIAARRAKRQDYTEYITMDCRHADTDASRQLVSMLSTMSHASVFQVISTCQTAISYFCHILYAFLRTKVDVIGCTLQDLISIIEKENEFLLVNGPSVFTELLITLSDKGLILFIQHPQSSWVVVKMEAVLRKINGTLFALCHFKEHYISLASNTGIVPTSNLHKVFPQYNLKMLVGVLKALDLCQPVDLSVLPYTNLQSTPSLSTTDLFFPTLVQSKQQNTLCQVGTLQFGWCLSCFDPDLFFGSHFLHVLFRIAYQFPLATIPRRQKAVYESQQRYTVWRKGILWRDSDNITTVVELISKNRWVLVAMSCSEDRAVEHAKLHSTLISLVRHLHQEHFRRLKVCKCLVSPSWIQQYPFDDLPNTDLFDIQDVAMSYLPTQSLPLEPYHVISPSSVCKLFNSSLADQPVPATLLYEVQEKLHLFKEDIQVHEKLRDYLDKLNIFAGRNPLVCFTVMNSCDNSVSGVFSQEVAGLKEEELPSDIGTSTAGGGDPSTILSESHVYLCAQVVQCDSGTPLL